MLLIAGSICRFKSTIHNSNKSLFSVLYSLFSILYSLIPLTLHYFLNIGSNLGDRKLNISRAIRALEAKYGYFETSKIFESQPWGYDSPNGYANVAVMVITDKSPRKVLEDIHEIEGRLNKSPHRDAAGNYADRQLDIDIMAADEISVDEPDLQIPHPHLAEREFFLVPFAELAPAWRHPATGLNCAEMILALNSNKTTEND